MRMVFPNTPGRLLDELSTDVNAFFESILGEDAPHKSDYAPPLDFEDRADAYELSIDLPGVDPNEIHVDVEDGHVAIQGTRSYRKEASPEVRRRVERSFGAFRRAIRLPKLVNKDDIVAKYEHGVLTVTLPKAAKRSHRVVVSHGGSPDQSNDQSSGTNP
jgi:HSP20 family protein